MVRVVLKYVYLVAGTALAMVATVGAAQNAERKADPDDDGINEGNKRAIRREQKQRLERSGEARSPMDAATYRANELVRRPIRTVSLFVGYQALFVGIAVCIAYTDAAASVTGPSVGPFIRAIGKQGASLLPAWIVPSLVPTAVALGLLFTLVVHQSLKTAGDIRRASV